VKAVLSVGGFGTRLRPLTETVKKELLPLVHRPILDHTLDRLVRNGVQDVAMSSPNLEAVDVGDGALTDIEGGRRAGLVGVWVDRGLAAPAGGPPAATSVDSRPSGSARRARRRQRTAVVLANPTCHRITRRSRAHVEMLRDRPQPNLDLVADSLESGDLLELQNEDSM